MELILIKAKVRRIKDADIDLLRQSLAGEYNKKKLAIIAAIESPISPTKKEL